MKLNSETYMTKTHVWRLLISKLKMEEKQKKINQLGNFLVSLEPQYNFLWRRRKCHLGTCQTKCFQWKH